MKINNKMKIVYTPKLGLNALHFGSITTLLSNTNTNQNYGGLKNNIVIFDNGSVELNHVRSKNTAMYVCFTSTL